MVHSNKVLTVSYGTFSCTLEGFEDSFDTMKAIAEYFRDLAADDRYFGAEPPQPDAEMLARIAQREIARQVEARREGAGIVLRAAEAAGPAALATAEVQPVAQPAAEAAAQPEPQVEAQPETQPEAQVEALPETSAAEASAVETPAAVETAEVAAAAPEVELAEVEAAEVEPEIEPEIAEAPAEAIVPDAPAAVVAETAEATEASVAAFMATAAPQPVEEEVEVVAEIAKPAAKPVSADSIAAKLQRIRAVVSRNEQAAPVPAYDEDYAEDQLEETASEHAFAAEAARDIAEALREDDEEEALFADLDAGETEVEAQEEDDGEDDGDIDLTNILLEAEAPRAQPLRLAPEARTVLPVEDLAEDDDEEEELQAAAPAARPLPPSTLSPEDEADLMRELAEVEAELRGDHAQIEEEEDFDAEEDEEEDQPIVLTAATAPTAAAETEQAAREAANSDLSRLMAAADAKLGEPEMATTRETYSHLRAAVAATQAEQSAGGLVGQHPDAEAYRADLARVVHPRRPATTGGRPARRAASDEHKPAPLKLVAEQRVDDMAPRTPRPGPVRPRRVAAAVETPRPVAPIGGGFAEFAAEMGATELPELLEAAAAYMQFVEGREQFTRPQLIHKAREASVEEFNREDGLRSFGLLLREGKIVKKDSGRFVASGEIGFQPASRAAG